GSARTICLLCTHSSLSTWLKTPSPPSLQKSPPCVSPVDQLRLSTSDSGQTSPSETALKPLLMLSPIASIEATFAATAGTGRSPPPPPPPSQAASTQPSKAHAALASGRQSERRSRSSPVSRKTSFAS